MKKVKNKNWVDLPTLFSVFKEYRPFIKLNIVHFIIEKYSYLWLISDIQSPFLHGKENESM